MDRKHANITTILLLSLFFFSPRILAQERLRIACIGNSITYGLYLSNRPTENYPAQLGKILGTTYTVRNFGCNGCTAQRQTKLPYWSQQLPDAMDYKPHIIILMLGSNDANRYNWSATETFHKDYTALVDTLIQLPTKPRILLCIPPPVFPRGSAYINDQILAEEITPLIQSTAQARLLELIDLRTPFVTADALFPDGIHPNRSGARQIADQVAAVLITTIINATPWSTLKTIPRYTK